MCGILDGGVGSFIGVRGQVWAAKVIDGRVCVRVGGVDLCVGVRNRVWAAWTRVWACEIVCGRAHRIATINKRNK